LLAGKVNVQGDLLAEELGSVKLIEQILVSPSSNPHAISLGKVEGEVDRLGDVRERYEKEQGDVFVFIGCL
jgi:hypothetical protein